jgi:hypothetical protein
MDTNGNTKELIKDLCSRLPYGVIVETPKGKGHVCDINLTIFGTEVGVNINPTIRDTFDVEDVKPYLLPLSSMTEEQKSYINGRWGVNKHFEFEIDPLWGEYFVDLCDAVGFINWCYENHFDINGLIPRGLAIDATGKNIY